MAKEKDSTVSQEERKALKRAEKEKKRSESDGVHKSKDKKEKKKERTALADKVANAVASGAVVVAEAEGETVKSEVEDENEEKKKKKSKNSETMMTMTTRPVGALVPFANPLADEKVARKVFKGVKKAAASKSLKRGVKEVVKAVRKSPTAPSSPPPGVVILAADISPMDVISHIPVLCEDHSIPYLYVTSRAELGMASQTKRPTSVVMLTGNVGGKVKKEGEKDREGESEWKETYAGLVKVVEREAQHVRI